jgi:hypothetical protein
VTFTVTIAVAWERERMTGAKLHEGAYVVLCARVPRERSKVSSAKRSFVQYAMRKRRLV